SSSRSNLPERSKGEASLAPTSILQTQLALGELRSLAGLVQTGLLALHLSRVARQEALALERHAQLGVRLDEGARDAVPDGACLRRARARASHARRARPPRQAERRPSCGAPGAGSSPRSNGR